MQCTIFWREFPARPAPEVFLRIDGNQKELLKSTNLLFFGQKNGSYSNALRLERADLLEFSDQEADELSLLFFFDVGSLGIHVHQKGVISAEISIAGVAKDVLQRISDSLDHGLLLMIALTVMVGGRHWGGGPGGLRE